MGLNEAIYPEPDYYEVSGPYNRLAVALGKFGNWGNAFGTAALNGEATIACTPVRDESCGAKCPYRYDCKADGRVRFFYDSLSISLPKWTDYDKAKPEHKKAWDAMIKALTAHEHGHIDIYKEFEEEVTISAFTSDCDGEKAIEAANVAWNKKTEDMLNKKETENVRRHDAYDEKTKHGATQGVDLPQI